MDLVEKLRGASKSLPLVLCLAAACLLAATFSPGRAWASVNVHKLEDLPFETAEQVAGHAVWQSNSKVSMVGSAKKSQDTWYSGITGYELCKQGDGILLQNVGTDVDGDAYDLRISLSRATGKTMADIYGEGDQGFRHPCRKSYARLDLLTESGAPKVGERIVLFLCEQSNGDIDLTFSYLKHGTSKAAKANLYGQVFDIDYNNDYDRPYWSNPVFGALEGQVFKNNGDIYLASNTKLKADASNGKVWIPAANAGNANGKDWRNGVGYAMRSSSTTITCAAGESVDFWFDLQKAPSPPVKGYEIQG